MTTTDDGAMAEVPTYEPLAHEVDFGKEAAFAPRRAGETYANSNATFAGQPPIAVAAAALPDDDKGGGGGGKDGKKGEGKDGAKGEDGGGATDSSSAVTL